MAVIKTRKIGAIANRTGALHSFPHRATHSQSATYYLKQLAQHGVRDLFPQICLENAIVVDAN
jgi:hypothetical protein